MKLFIFYLSIFILFIELSSCGSDNAPVTPSSNNNTGFSSGTISNWSLGTKKLIANVEAPEEIYIIDSTTISNEGSFSLNLNSHFPPDTSLDSFDPVNPNCSGNLNIIPSGAKHTWLFLDVAESNGSIFGYLQRTNYSGSPLTGSIKTNIIYCDTNVTVNGTKYCDYGSPPIYEFNFNFSGQKGWVNFTKRVDTLTSQFVISTYSGSFPNGLQWHYFKWNDNPGDSEFKNHILRLNRVLSKR